MSARISIVKGLISLTEGKTLIGIKCIRRSGRRGRNLGIFFFK